MTGRLFGMEGADDDLLQIEGAGDIGGEGELVTGLGRGLQFSEIVAGAVADQQAGDPDTMRRAAGSLLQLTVEAGDARREKPASRECSTRWTNESEMSPSKGMGRVLMRQSLGGRIP